MNRSPIITVSRRLPEPVEAALRTEFDARLNTADQPLGPDRLQAALRESDALIPTVGDRLPADMFAGTPLRTRIIANYGVGTDHIDLEAARARGIVVTNTPDVLTDCTADLTIALMLAVMRRLGEAERELRAGQWTGWRPTHVLGTRVTGKTLGIIGFGRIGQAVARRAYHGLRMRILFHTPHPPEGPDPSGMQATPCETIEELLEQADVVSLHAPATPATRHLINAQRLLRMKPSAFLINTARGDLVDTWALIQAVRSGRIAGAGLDVFENEPRIDPALLELPQLVLLPHIGSATTETRTAMGFRVLENLRAFFRGREPPDRVV